MTKQTSLGLIAEIYLSHYCSTHGLKRPLTPEQVKDAGIAFLDDVAAAEIQLMLDHERESEEPHSREPDELEFGNCQLKTLLEQFVEGYFSNFE